MEVIKVIAYTIVSLYLAVVVLLYIFQTKLIFYPGKLSKDFRFKLGPLDEEAFLTTSDDEQINALFFCGVRNEVILYFHGNAGDLSGWQFVAEDFTRYGYSVLIIDYRGYGKSSGSITEKGLYNDAEAAYYFLINKKGFTPQSIIAYGRSIGSGIAVDLASRYRVKGLVLESAYASLGRLAKEKFPLFFPVLYLKHKFNNLEKIAHIKNPVIFIHGQRDSLIPPAHSQTLYKNCPTKKHLAIIPNGAHNDLISFPEYHTILREVMPDFFSKNQ